VIVDDLRAGSPTLTLTLTPTVLRQIIGARSARRYGQEAVII
jgi:hypothetical protein